MGATINMRATASLQVQSGAQFRRAILASCSVRRVHEATSASLRNRPRNRWWLHKLDKWWRSRQDLTSAYEQSSCWAIATVWSHPFGGDIHLAARRSISEHAIFGVRNPPRGSASNRTSSHLEIAGRWVLIAHRTRRPSNRARWISRSHRYTVSRRSRTRTVRINVVDEYSEDNGARRSWADAAGESKPNGTLAVRYRVSGVSETAGIETACA
jgi:hypothetical protein